MLIINLMSQNFQKSLVALILSISHAGYIIRLLLSNTSHFIIEPIFDLKNKLHEKAVSAMA